MLVREGPVALNLRVDEKLLLACAGVTMVRSGYEAGRRGEGPLRVKEPEL
jgi:hypothetical protein